MNHITPSSSSQCFPSGRSRWQTTPRFTAGSVFSVLSLRGAALCIAPSPPKKTVWLQEFPAGKSLFAKGAAVSSCWHIHHRSQLLRIFHYCQRIIIQVARKGWLFFGIVILLLVGESGFEPLKDKPPDLQSGTFDQLGYSPIYGAQSETRTRTSRRTPVPETGAYTIPPSVHCGETFRIRTRYAQDFNQPLYKLSEKRTGGVRAGPDAQSPLLNRPLSREVSIQSEYHSG